MLGVVAQYFESNCFSWRAKKIRNIPTTTEDSTLKRKYCVVRKLGAGGYGTVFLVARRSDGKQFAAKIVPKQRCRRTTWCPRRQMDIPDEVHIWEGLSHERILRMEESFQERGHWILVTDYHPGFQDLFDYNTGRDKLTEMEVKMILRQVAEVCLSLRDDGIDHRDIKDENLLYNPETKEIKLLDFGSAARIKSSYSQIQGTDVYIPQEYYTTGQYTADNGTVWALGCLAYILLMNEPPFLNRDHVRAHESLSWSKAVSGEAQAFVEQCLEKDVNQRWGLDKLVGCDWLDIWDKKVGETRLQRHG